MSAQETRRASRGSRRAGVADMELTVAFDGPGINKLLLSLGPLEWGEERGSALSLECRNH